MDQAKTPLRKHQGKIVIGSLILTVCLAGAAFISTSHLENSFLQSGPERTLAKTTKTITDFDIVKTYIREGKQYYTEGLIFYDSDTLVESAGNYKESEIHFVEMPSMKVSKKADLADKYFGEGVVMFTKSGVKRLYQLTWKERAILVWNAETLVLEKTVTIPSVIKEGWGLTKNIETINGSKTLVFYFSDGTGNIYQVNPDSLKVLKTISTKKYNGTKLNRLNELEMVNGKLWANIYPTSQVAVIDLSTGYADYIIDFSKLLTLAKAQAKKQGLTIASGDVLNGMAYDSTNDKLIMTGKMWPMMWEIKVNGI